MRIPLMASALAWSSVAIAGASPITPAPQIVIVGHGVVKQAPDVAVLSFSLKGEGHVADEATRALVAQKDMALRTFAALGVAEDNVHTGALSMDQVRPKQCDDGDGSYQEKARLSEGVCAVIGFVGKLEMTVRMRPKDVGTAAGLMTRLGASDVNVSRYELENQKALQSQAIAAALADARLQADAIAKGSGVHVGSLLSVRDERASEPGSDDVLVTARRFANAPPVVETPPIVLSLSPSPVEQSADLVVTYALTP